jgi:hypothetical protein
MSYSQNNGSNGSRPGGARALSGASLAQMVRHMRPAERALIAADIVDGKVIVQGMTTKSVAMIVGTSIASAFAALRLSPEQREAVKRGQRPLVTSRSSAKSESVGVDWTKVDDETLTDIVWEVGIERVLEAAATAEANGIHA